MQLSEEIIKDVASWLDVGMVCFIHKETHKVLSMPDPIEFYEAEGFEDIRDEIEKNEDKYLQIDKMGSTESFGIMERFVDEVSSPEIKKRLLQALEKRKPFRNFKYEIDQLGEEREQWFKFKSRAYQEWVKNEISFQMEDEEE